MNSSQFGNPYLPQPNPYFVNQMGFMPSNMTQPVGMYPAQIMPSPLVNQTFGQQSYVQSVMPTEIDVSYMNSLDDDQSRKDYLGEVIYKQIENHPITIQSKLSIDLIGRITGMILGIEELEEIYNTASNYDLLTQRIQEACDLLQSNQ